MAVNARLRELVQLLETGTDKNRLSWVAEAPEDEFRAPLSSGAASISKRETVGLSGPFEGPVNARYCLSAFDQKGIVIDQFEPTDPEEIALVEELYRKVRRAALNLDWAWDTFMKELRDKVSR